jgi:hypothetical protein
LPLFTNVLERLSGKNRNGPRIVALRTAKRG